MLFEIGPGICYVDQIGLELTEVHLSLLPWCLIKGVWASQHVILTS